MTWFKCLYETYNNVLGDPRYDDDEDNRLMPVGHTSQQVHIIVRIDGNGNFLGAEFINKQSVILPATEDSAGRTSGRVAHPLIDQIKYCAKDYARYSGNEGYFSKETLSEKKLEKPEAEQPKTYLETLQGWVSSPNTHPMAQAVYDYVRKGTLVADLVRENILHLDADGKLMTVAPEGQEIPVFKVLTAKKDTEGIARRDQGNLMIAWQVEISGEPEPRTWKNKSLQESWIVYDASQMDKTGLCMVSGTEMLLANQHPRNIRRPGDGAKLVSANDKSGFTYRGRFTTAEQACSVGYTVSHKAHNALRWLIARQGYKNDTQVILAWTPKGIPLPQPCDDLMADDLPDFESMADTPEKDLAGTEQNTQVDHRRDLGATFSEKLKRSLRGYDGKIGESDTVAILGLDSATPGRLSVVFYMEQFWPEYRETLESWYNDMSWWIRRTRESAVKTGKKKKTEVFWKATAPTPNEIAMAAYGKRMDTQLKKNTVERLLSCIAEKRPIPLDLMNCCVNRACNRAGLENWEWETVLGVACAMYKGYCKRHPVKTQRREYTMGLDENNTSRDYLYGRLLAIAERMERVALARAEENRPTNAERLMQRFADSPYTTWRQLEMALQPYRQRLMQGRAGFVTNMDKLMDSILNAFDPEAFMKAGRLSGEFLLGYHCQRQAFRTAKESGNDEQTQGENE